MGAARILTVGHSNRSLEELVALLLDHRVDVVLDVRSLRGSRAVPQFNEERLGPALEEFGIRYLPVPELGGRRHAPKSARESSCWHNAAFASYASHVGSEEFLRGVDVVLREARHGTAALLCAEAVPWRCHRSLIADWLTVERGVAVDELVGDQRRPHRLTVCAHVVRGHLSYEATA
jgi:uncharacterized protein (DUF488 family)